MAIQLMQHYKIEKPNTHTHTQTQSHELFKGSRTQFPGSWLLLLREIHPPKFDCVAFECCLLTIFQKNNFIIATTCLVCNSKLKNSINLVKRTGSSALKEQSNWVVLLFSS